MEQEKPRTYVAIDLKSFYASVECRERDLNPLTTNLVVADVGRTEKTICLAVSAALKSFGIPGRPRLFEVVRRMREVNAERRRRLGREFSGSSCQLPELDTHPELAADYIVAMPRMAHYMEYSTRIYRIYLRFIAPEDIHVYSIDEVMMDVTDYLAVYHLTARELTMKMIREVLDETGITATAGIGTNLYLAKVAMDIVAKHVDADADGVRIAELDEMSYRRLLWNHRPLTSFWRVGRGYAGKLEEHGLYTMGDIARCSLGGPGDYYNEDLLYRLFGINAELLIDHAWGWEPCRMSDIKAYRPESNSLSSGQVLMCPYDFGRARLVVQEMADLLALDLVDKGLVTDQMVLTVGYEAVRPGEAADGRSPGRAADGGLMQGAAGSGSFGKVGAAGSGSPGKVRAVGSGSPGKVMVAGSGSPGRAADSGDSRQENTDDLAAPEASEPEFTTDRYGRRTPKHARGTVNLERPTSSARLIVAAVLELYDHIVNEKLPIRRLNVTANHVMDERSVNTEPEAEQLEMFTDYEARERRKQAEQERLEKEKKLQKAVLDIKKKFGKNAVLKGMNLQEGATARQRNEQIGGHKA